MQTVETYMGFAGAKGMVVAVDTSRLANGSIDISSGNVPGIEAMDPGTATVVRSRAITNAEVLAVDAINPGAIVGILP